MAIPIPLLNYSNKILTGNQHFFQTQQKKISKLVISKTEDTSERHISASYESLYVIKQKHFTKPEETG